MTDENALPDWVAPGKTVLTAQIHHFGGTNYRLDKAKVAKLTATQVVLDNGDRYRRRNLERIEARRDRGRFYNPMTVLKDPESAEMKAELELHRTRIIRDKAFDAIADIQRANPLRDDINEAIRALEAWRERLPQ